MTSDFKINVGNVLAAVQAVKQIDSINFEAVIFTGGGLAHHPSKEYASLSIGKSGLLLLANLLFDDLKRENIYLGVLTIQSYVNADDHRYAPDKIAAKIWQLSIEHEGPEVIY